MKSRTPVVIAMFLQPFNGVMAVGEQERPSRWRSWESHFHVGSQAYMNDLDPDPGSVGLFGPRENLPPVGPFIRWWILPNGGL